jgi:2,3-bisphosphoglycerate-dependent phosphoglycerate mutase
MQAGERVMQHITGRANSLLQEISTDTLKIFVGHGAAFRHAAVHMGLMTTAKAVALSMYHCTPLYFERIKDDSNINKWQHIAGEWKIRKAINIDLD